MLHPDHDPETPDLKQHSMIIHELHQKRVRLHRNFENQAAGGQSWFEWSSLLDNSQKFIDFENELLKQNQFGMCFDMMSRP